MPKLILPPRKISESPNTSGAPCTPVDPGAGPPPNISPLPPTDAPVVNPNTRSPPVPIPNTGIMAPTSVLPLSPLFIDGNPHSKVVTPLTLSRPSPSSNRRKGPPRIVACVSCHRQKKKCGGERPCTRCVTLGVVCKTQERPNDGFQYVRKKKKLRTQGAMNPLPQLPIHHLSHPAPFPGSLWASVAQQASYDNPAYQNQLPSPSPSLTMVGTPSDPLSERDLSYQGSGPGRSDERRDRSPQAASVDVTQCYEDESAPTPTPVSIEVPPSPSPEPDSVANQPTSHPTSDCFDTAPELVLGPPDLDFSLLADLEVDFEMDLELFGSPENEDSLIDGCDVVDTPTLSEQAGGTTQLDKEGGDTASNDGFTELGWEEWNRKCSSADVAHSPSFLDLNGGFDFLERPPPCSPAPTAPTYKHTPRLQLEGAAVTITTQQPTLEREEDTQSEGTA